MATLTIRLDDQRHRELERLARERNSTVSDMVRVAIDGLLRRDVPQSLDMVARRELALLHEILARVDPDEDAKRSHRRSATVLSSGFTSEYGREFYALDTELSHVDGSLLCDILDMFAVLEAAADRLGDEVMTELGGDARALLEFGGFDYQDPKESRFVDFAEYLIQDDRWASLAHHFGDQPDEPNCPNSHTPMLQRYERMLLAYSAVVSERLGPSGVAGFDTYRLTLRDLAKVLNATGRPEC